MSAEGGGDAKRLEVKDGVVRVWNTDYPVFAGVEGVRFSKSNASLTYSVSATNAQQTVQAIVDFYKGKTIGKFSVGDFVPREDFMPDSVGFTAGKKPRGQGLAIYVIPQGNSVIVYIHPHRK